MTNEAINQESVNESVNESVVVDNAVNAIVAKAEKLNKKARREALKADTVKAAKADTVKAAKADTAQSFFNTEEVEKQLALEIENKEAVKAVKAAKAAKANNASEKALVSSCYRDDSRYIFTSTAIVDIACCIAARSVERVSCTQLDAYIVNVLKCEDIRHREKTNSVRIRNHCKKSALNTTYLTIENDVITFTELMKKTVKSEQNIAHIDQLANKLIAANS